MISKNTKNEYDISGTNEGVIFGLSSDVKPTDPTIHNGYEFYEMDTKKKYLYDEQNQVWRAWDNNNPSESTGVGLNIAGASVGQVATVTSVDGDGTPQAWTPVDIATVSNTTLILP